jgi:ribose transport system permease protein
MSDNDQITSTTAIKAPDLPGQTRRFRWSSIAILIPLVVVIVALSIGNPDAFLSMRNISNVLDREAAPLIIAAAWTLVLIAGGFDLSVGATYYLTSVVVATFVIQIGGIGGTVLGMVVGVLLGILVGTISGVVSTYLKINSLIATLAMNFIVVGVANLVSQIVKADAGQLRVTDPAITWIAEMLRAPNITLPTWIMLAFVIILGVILWRTTFGRYVYAVGGNAEASRLAGIRVNLVKIATFAIAGFAASLAGIIDLARTQAPPNSDSVALTTTFFVLAGVVVGGNSILGGEGAVWRSVVGILFIALLYNGFTLLQIDSLWQNVALGVIILIAVGIEAWVRVRRR